ncbi:hypothetical protein H2200_005253 [Cladophialophora chaetospira]|uniref:Zn(2)-C6 fungal-type domain-containing protein n=1 Tax=Cladophialophora chaetospira TaxID=386627 RepID=A0AA38XBU2_9EURO|nr:hypothetical protein H2200_005253 [Cladophialophora chaetospira]
MAESLGRVRSCSECRIQKLKCDAREDFMRPCTRCRKKNLVCELSRGVKRSQRKTKAELARENASLHERLQDSQFPAGREIRTTTLSPQNPKTAPPVSHSQFVPRIRHDGQASDITSHAGNDSARSIDLQGVPTGTNGFQVTPTALQIDHIGGRKIKDCFALFVSFPSASLGHCLTQVRFFAHYEGFIPGLFDPNMLPERYYELSPFLFWCIVATGARRYADDPTLFQRIVSQVLKIALETLFSFSNPFPKIQAVLLLCLWPIPTNTLWQDSSHALAGVAMQLAVQNGLHIFGHEQDYARQNIDTANSEVSLRFRLWIYCLVVFQNTNLIGGFPCWTVSELNDIDSDPLLEHTLSPSILYRYRLHKVQTDAIQAITQSTQLLKPDCGPPLNSLVEVFDAQVRALVPDINVGIDALYQKCTRLSIKAFHFFAAPDAARSAGLVQLYALSCSMLDMLHELDVTRDLALYSTQWLHRMLVLASHSILKITRSELRSHVDLEHGERAYFKAIKFSKRRSAENNDLDSRTAIILTQLWASDSIFRKKDGTLIGDRLRLRSRLFASVIFDTFWHWRATFGEGKVNPYRADDDEVDSSVANRHPNSHWTSPSLFIAPSLQSGNSVTPSAHNTSTLQAPVLDFDAFNAFPDWEWATEVPLGDGIDFTTMSHFSDGGLA